MYKKIFINYVFSSMAGSCGAHRIKTAIAADSSPVPTAHSTVTSRTRVPGPTFCCLGGGPVSSPALMASRFRVPSTACGFGAGSRSVDPNLPHRQSVRHLIGRPKVEPLRSGARAGRSGIGAKRSTDPQRHKVSSWAADGTYAKPAESRLIPVFLVQRDRAMAPERQPKSRDRRS
jgi:hypothetical protein